MTLEDATTRYTRWPSRGRRSVNTKVGRDLVAALLRGSRWSLPQRPGIRRFCLAVVTTMTSQPDSRVETLSLGSDRYWCDAVRGEERATDELPPWPRSAP